MNEQETHAEVIAEMRGAKTEFPFVYLMGEPDTPEIVDVRTKEIMEPRKINSRRVTVKELAGRLEAAHKRERGDAAKLREACIYALAELEHFRKCHDARLHFCDIVHVGNAKHALKTALSAPPRNCDMPLVVDGPADNNADKAWIVFKRHNPDAYFDVSGLLRCIDWLYAPAAEKEGGAK